MMRKIIATLIAVMIITGGVVAISAFEASIINVTAHIENALKVIPQTGEISFGTVFPQEKKSKAIFVTTSESFCNINQRRVLNIDYKIVQNPKPIWPVPGSCASGAQTIDRAREYCISHPTDGFCCYTSLCPYLGKQPAQTDPSPFTDFGIAAFHDPSDPSSVARGTINKDRDISDEWKIDLAVPCFKGMCSQDWPSFVGSSNPNADPHLFEASGTPTGTDFGCDLWVEVTKIY